MKNDLLPFFEKHGEEFLDFYHSHPGQESLCQIMILFVEHKGLPFNMKTYMHEQSSYIKSELSSLKLDQKDECQRQLIVAKWIHQEAHNFRRKVISTQTDMLAEFEELILDNLPKCIIKGL